MQILNDPTHPVRHYFDSRRAATGVEDFYSLKQIQTVIGPRFYPLLCQFLTKITITLCTHASRRLLKTMTFKDFQTERGRVYLT